MKLSQRLQYILEQIPEGSKLADIGSDHALLPVAAVRSGRAVQAIAGEVNSGPLLAARKQVEAAGLTARIAVRKGDGLEVLNPGEADVITVAGMGGALIASILDKGPDKLEAVKKLILQPNVGEDILRNWLILHDWVLIGEHMLEEDGKIYEVLVAVKSADTGQSQEDVYQTFQLPECSVVLSRELLVLLGPYLVKRPTEVFFRKWRGEIENLQVVKKQVALSGQESAREKYEQLDKHITQLEEVLACLLRDKP